MHTVEQICEAFDLDPKDILNVYAYGSRVYGTHTPDSDYDYIVVHKAALLNGGVAMKENAKTSADGTIQIINYSRTGFKAAIEQFEISALECLFLPKEFVLQAKWPYKIDRFDNKEFASKIIAKASNSWHIALLCLSDDDENMAYKGIYHALRILAFANQIKEGNSIDFSSAQNIVADINQFEISKEVIKKEWEPKRNELMEKLRV